MKPVKSRYEVIAEEILARLYDIHPPKPREPQKPDPAQSSRTVIFDLPFAWQLRKH